MAYRRLPFEQYFINTSEDFNHTGRATYPVTYTPVCYECRDGLGKLMKVRHEVNYEIHYEPDRNVIQLNFQKTTGRSDWFANIFEFSDKYYDAITFEERPLQLRVHHGWGNMYLAIKREIRSRWQQLHEEHPDADTEIVGWSLGSGQAILCCQDLNYNFGVRPYLITFGSVRPFKSVRRNARRMARYLEGVCTECWNIADRNDVVTYMPPFRGFRMIRRVEVGQEKRTIWRLLRPFTYHTHYDLPALYAHLSRTDTEGTPLAADAGGETQQI